MVARITYGQTVKGAVYYNEQKVIKGVAKVLGAEGYWKDAQSLTFPDKLGMLEKRASLNDKVKIKCLHVSLNFDPSEKLSDTKLNQIAKEYMEGIGFGDQPYVIYQHQDTAHPHIHIVTTTIKTDGNQINLNNIVTDKSEPTRKALEKKFDLVIASRKEKAAQEKLLPVNIEKAQAGKSVKKRAITNIVNEVIRSYKFTSLAEFNMALRQFNIVADPGTADSQMRQHNGLMYHIIGDDGLAVGKGIKASAIYNQPTIAELEKKYAPKKAQRKKVVNKTRKAIDSVLLSRECTNRRTFAQLLSKRGIKVVYHENANGRLYGVSFIDNVNRCVYSGSDLGPKYGANELAEYLVHKGENISSSEMQTPNPSKNNGNNIAKSFFSVIPNELPQDIQKLATGLTNAAEDLLINDNNHYMPDPYKKKKKRKKKKKGLGL